MQYIEAPSDEVAAFPSVFLAGGITNCPDWQAELVEHLRPHAISIFNPRRKNFPMDDPSAADEQIRWEYQRLQEAHIHAFWFSRGSDNPIVLYEYGFALGRNVTLPLVGVDSQYRRRQDVYIQTKLARPNVDIVESLDHLARRIIWVAEQIFLVVV